jgi:ABC-type branched-subunit amino acid transport system substrate-binding protein
LSKKYLWSFCIIAVLIVSSILIGCAPTATPTPTTPTTPTPTAAPKEYKIGNIETITGISSDNLKISAWAAMIAQDYINSKGGFTVGGQKYTLKVVQQDNQFNPDRAAAAAESMVADGIKYVVGCYPEFIRMAVNSVLRPANVMYVPAYDAADPPEMDKDLNKYTFYVNGGTLAFYDMALKGLKILHPEVKTAGFCLIDDGSIAGSKPYFVKKAAENGIELLDIVGYAPTATDYSPYAQKLMALKPDAILVGNGPTEGEATVLRLVREQGYTKPVCMVNSNPMEDVTTVAGPSASTNFIGVTIRADNPDLAPITKEVFALSLAKHNKADNIVCNGFSEVYTTIKMIEMANSFDVPAVAAKWESLDEIPTAWGTCKMGGQQTWGFKHFAHQKMFIYTADNNVISYSSKVGPIQLWLP